MKKIYICTNKAVAVGRPSCGMRGSERTIEELTKELVKREQDVEIEPITCLGQCNEGPTLRIAGGGNFYLGAYPEKVSEIADWLEREFSAKV